MLNKRDTAWSRPLEGNMRGYLTIGLDGSVYVGSSLQTDSGSAAVVTKYRPDGTIIWSKSLGTGSSAYTYAHSLTTGLDGAVYVAGMTNGSLDGQPYKDQFDVFLTKFSPDGTTIWTRLFGSISFDIAYALTAGNDGAVYVGGSTQGNFDGQQINGIGDGFLTKYDAGGTQAWTKLLGWAASPGDFVVAHTTGLTTGFDGSIYVAGFGIGPSKNGYDAFLTKYNPDGTRGWTQSLASGMAENTNAITTGLDGAIYVAGQVWDFPGQGGGWLDGQMHSGGAWAPAQPGLGPDAFITKYNVDGTKAWTRLLGTSGNDQAYSLTVGEDDGAIYVGGWTDGSFGEQSGSGVGQQFLAKFSPDGTRVWVDMPGGFNSIGSLAAVDGAIYFIGGELTKLVNAIYSDTSYTLSDGETKLVLTGTASINGTGNALDNNIAGNSGANTLNGFGGNDTLKGGAGNDFLDGGAGMDTADYS